MHNRENPGWKGSSKTESKHIVSDATLQKKNNNFFHNTVLRLDAAHAKIG